PPSDRTRVLEALAELAPPGERFGIKVDTESGQAVLLADTEDQLDALVGKLLATTTFEVQFGAPQVAYRETIVRPVTVTYTHKKQAGGAGQFAQVMIDFEPAPDSGFTFESDTVALAPEFVASVEQGVRAQKESGILAGFPVIDFKATLKDGKYHEVDSSPVAFEIAARAAFRELSKENVARLLEPVMTLE